MQSHDLHIGEMVRSVWQQTGLSGNEFSNRIGQARQNLQHVLGRETMDTGLLFEISKVLDYDFFKEYSQRLQAPSAMPESVPSQESNGGNAAALAAELRFAQLALEAAQTEVKYLKEIVDLLRQRPGA